jgi:ABC-type sulfate/molybdate transport systems ATPase subunit
MPTILVSHDLEDVAGLPDRVAVMDAGKTVQTGTTSELLQAPASGFVAAFVGANYFVGKARRAGRLTEIDLDEGGRIVSESEVLGRVGVVVQPWHVSLGAPVDSEPGVNVLSGPVTSVAPHGSRLRVTVASSPPIVADVPAQAAWVSGLAPGDVVAAMWPHALTRLVPDDTGTAVG